MKKRYRVLIGIEYGGKAAPAGAEVDDVPRRSVPWLLEQGAIEEIAVEAEGEAAPTDESAPGEEGR